MIIITLLVNILLLFFGDEYINVSHKYPQNELLLLKYSKISNSNTIFLDTQYTVHNIY